MATVESLNRWRFALLTLALAGISSAQAPQSTGTIQGDLVDSTGGAAPGVKIRAVNEASGASRTASSDAAGHFRLAGLTAGVYTLHLELDGFAPVTVGPFPVSLGQTVTQRVEMKPAHVIEKIEVQGQPEALEATATTAAATLGGDRIEEAPASNRNFPEFRAHRSGRRIVRRLECPALAGGRAQRGRRQRIHVFRDARTQQQSLHRRRG